MNIPINKDVAEEYKGEWIKGFTYREVFFVAVSIVVIVGVTALVYWKTGVAIDICIYIGLPFGFPTLIFGFKKIQGLTANEYLKEMFYEWQTRSLTYDADELPEENHVFAMEAERIGKRGK